MKKVFIINGSGGVGKDTFVSLVSDVVKFGVLNYSSVDKIKEIAREIGWDGGKTEKDRRFLSDLKILCAEYNDLPFNSMKQKYEEFLSGNWSVMFLHIREPNEIEKAKAVFSANTVLVRRDSVKHITSNMADENVYNYSYDYEINNNGTIDDLLSEAIRFADVAILKDA